MLLWHLLFQSDLKVHNMGLTFFVGVSRFELTNEVHPKLPCVYWALSVRGSCQSWTKLKMCRAHSETRPQFLQCKDVRKCNPYFIQKGKCAIVERIVEGHIKNFILKPGAKVNAPSSPVFLVISSSLFFLL